MTIIHIMTGDTRSKKVLAILSRYGWGRMALRDTPSPYPGEKWGFDNGAFGWFLRGLSFNEDLFQRRLDRAYAVGVPYLAVTPDIVGDGERSLPYSLGWLDRLPEDWPWYLAVQDGMTLAQVTPHVHRFSGLFLGGTDSFKATAWYWSELAHRYGKKFHYGRAGTPRKLWHAMESGADSADSAFPLWSMERMAEFMQAATEGDRQMRFFGAQEAAVCPGSWEP